MRLPLVVTVFFGSHLDPALLRRHLQAGRLEHQSQRDYYLSIRPNVKDPFERATLDLGIAYEDTWLEWLESLPWIQGRQTPPVVASAGSLASSYLNE